ncbi:antibiotic biosynthesis monooxygenase [Actinoplanes sp. N902-109]|uniref:antibiotic biosynthesis monooxygenase family protein n=1 Tax=Actinoplanes sp. (strain N902-109) TaxID=649831 RepID=UPI000329424A|nr:antibiotic biosynthesis monooxygenase family protein [Actinoplanes sp. N902-109]AGL16614.1 GrhU [Actinoplanes sp. N902-109]
MSAGATFRVQLRMHIRPGMEADFERVWLEIGDGVTGHPANRGQWLAKDAENEGVYVIVSDWTDEASFRVFEHSEGHLRHRERLHPFRSGGDMSTMTIVAYLPSAAGVTP